ncbi:MAG: prolyl oligopeptidase family protein [Candidatus Hodarchaeota archaeon]
MEVPTLQYPATKEIPVRETIHSTVIEDNFRWLENTADAEVQEWISKQNSFTESFLKNYPGRERVEERLRELAAFDDITGEQGLQLAKTNEGTVRFFYILRKANETQAILCYQDGEDGERIELINPIDISAKGLVTIDWFYPSPNGKLVAYGLSKEGDEISTLYIIDVETKVRLSEEIPQTRGCSVAWFPDNSGFYYTRNPLPGTVPPGDEHYYKHVFYHKLGAHFQEDTKVFGEGRNPSEIPIIKMSRDGQYLAVIGFRFTYNDVYLARIRNQNPTNLEFHPVIEENKGIPFSQFYENHFFLLSSFTAPNGAIYRFDLDKFFAEGEARNGHAIIKESEEVIIRFAVTDEFIAVIKDKDASSRLFIHDRDSGKVKREVEFETLVTLRYIVSAPEISQVYFMKSSFFSPSCFSSYKLNEKPKNLFKPAVKIDESKFAVKQVWYSSKDGTKVSMFILSKNDWNATPNTPILLTGYGGFNYPLTPLYSLRSIYHLAWIENGGIVAIPNLRGGNEYGEAWHQAGMRENKQNVFDDFIAAAEWLIANNYGSKETLAISGRSNGGLLVGAALTQRPDLFSAVYCGVPLLDMLRYTRFLIAKFWIPEYGDPDKPDEFQWLYAYSPYHNVEEGINYPPVLFYTAEGDSRVDPMHALKMAARLQAMTRSKIQNNPILLWVETQAGHGVGMPVDKVVTVRADELLFLADKTGLSLS